MKIILFASILALAPALGKAQAGEQQVEGVKLQRTVYCASSDLGIYGADNTIEVRGHCKHLVVHGDGHRVRFEQADEVAISGTNHKVSGGRARSLSVETADNEVQAKLDSSTQGVSLDVSGANQNVTVQLQSPARIDVSGTQHSIRWSAPSEVAAPEIDISGIDNQVERLE